jgi:hypothetical protein
LDATVLAAQLETLSACPAVDDNGLEHLQGSGALPGISAPGFGVPPSPGADWGTDTTGSTMGNDVSLATEEEMVDAAAPTPKLAAAEAADMTVEIPASLFATPFPSRKPDPVAFGKSATSDEVLAFRQVCGPTQRHGITDCIVKKGVGEHLW